MLGATKGLIAKNLVLPKITTTPSQLNKTIAVTKENTNLFAKPLDATYIIIQTETKNANEVAMIDVARYAGISISIIFNI